jgi:hypothetical protein
MLPEVDALFTLVRQLAKRERVSDVAAPKWLVQRHGLAAMAARAGAVSYRDDLAVATVQWALLEREVSGVVGALVRAGISVAPIKGFAYASSLYDNPAERPMGDVDLLVHPRDVGAARDVLRGVGFARGPAMVMHHAEAWTRGTLAIDLHTSMIASGRARIDLDALWSRMQPGWQPGAHQLEASDALGFHLLHLARNRLRLPLMNVVDFARLLDRASADAVLERASQWGVRRAVAWALRFCRSIIAGDPAPAGGWPGPSRQEVVDIAPPTTAQKIAFDVVTAGSMRQLTARSLGFALNRARGRR